MSKPDRTTPLFRSGIAQCEKANAFLAPADVVRIWEAAKRCIEGGGDGVPELLEIPVQVGPVTLWPRRIGAALWWERYGKKWYGGGGSVEDEVLALAWMLAHGRDADLFRRTTSKLKCDAHLIAWQIGLAASVTLPALAWGIQKLFGRFDETPDGATVEASTEMDWGRVVAQLCATYHQKPDYFLWEIGEGVARDMLIKSPPPPGCSRPSDESISRYGDFVAVVRDVIANAPKKGGE